MLADVRLGSLADIRRQLNDVRFTPNSGHQAVRLRVRFVPLAAIRIAASAPSFEYLVDADQQ